jgi:hypothetical protein
MALNKKGKELLKEYKKKFGKKAEGILQSGIEKGKLTDIGTLDKKKKKGKK